MPVYRIRDWSEHFENNRTRDLKELRFVVMPNKHDGDGYTELLDHPNGAAHYGAWCVMVQVASKGRHPAGGCGIAAGCCECRGILLREGARGHDSASLSRVTRVATKVFDEAIPRLIKIGWIEDIGPKVEGISLEQAIPHPPAVPIEAESRTPLLPSRARAEWNGMEENGMEGKEKKPAAAGVEFPPFSGSEFLEALSGFEQHRKEKRAKLTPTARRALYKRLSAMGEKPATDALIYSTEMGYQGVFERASNGTDKSKHTAESTSERRSRIFREQREIAAKLRSEGSGHSDQIPSGNSGNAGG